VVREALFNVVKHAGTDSASITLRRDGPNLAIEIGDDGDGFDPDKVTGAGAVGRGLAMSRQRMSLFGGSLNIQSTPSEGTRIVISAPLE
jgi:signal transduction histidine kinase